MAALESADLRAPLEPQASARAVGQSRMPMSDATAEPSAYGFGIKQRANPSGTADDGRLVFRLVACSGGLVCLAALGYATRAKEAWFESDHDEGNSGKARAWPPAPCGMADGDALMADIKSGTTTERVLRNAALTLLVSGYAAYSFYDGYIAYPVQNIKAVFKDQLGISAPDPLPVCRRAFTAADIVGIKPGMNLDDASRELGGAGFEHEGVSYFFGSGGFIQMHHDRNRVQSIAWTPGPVHRPTDIALQIWMGWILAVGGGLLIVRFLSIVRTRAILNDGGLTIGAGRMIRFAKMKSLAKGKHDEVVVLHYDDGPRSRSVLLDRYVFKQQPRIIEAICERTGLPKPNGPRDAEPRA